MLRIGKSPASDRMKRVATTSRGWSVSQGDVKIYLEFILDPHGASHQADGFDPEIGLLQHGRPLVAAVCENDLHRTRMSLTMQLEIALDIPVRRIKLFDPDGI